MEEAVLMLWLESKKKGTDQLMDQFRQLQPGTQVRRLFRKGRTIIAKKLLIASNKIGIFTVPDFLNFNCCLKSYITKNKLV